MSDTGQEQRAEEERQLRDLAAQLRALSTSAVADGKQEDIKTMADEAEGYAQRIHDAADAEQAAALIAEATPKRARWMALYETLFLAGAEAEPLAEAEDKLRRTAAQLRTVASTGSTPVFKAIGSIAGRAEAGLQEFLAAETTEAKWDVFNRLEEAKAGWSAEMTALQSRAGDIDDDAAQPEPAGCVDYVPAPGGHRESQAGMPYCTPMVPAVVEVTPENIEIVMKQAECSWAQAVKALQANNDDVVEAIMAVGDSDNEEVPSAVVPQVTEGLSRPAQAMALVQRMQGGAPETAADAEEETAALTAADAEESAPAPIVIGGVEISPGVELGAEEYKALVIKCLTDEEEGLLRTLRTSVPKVLEDDRFEAVHDDAKTLLEQMELAAGAVVPDLLPPVDFSDDLAGAEDKLKAIVEPMRKAQWGGFYSKQAASKIRRYDLYNRTKPKLKDHHEDFLACAVASVKIGNYLHKQAQNAILDSVVGLVAQTNRISESDTVV